MTLQGALRTSILCVLLSAPWLATAFYLPGVAPTTYAANDRVPLNVNHLTPGFSNDDTHLHSVFSYDYYHPAFRFCQPEGGPKRISESLGSILFGDRILNSPYELYMMKNETCKVLCEEQKFDPAAATFVNIRIRQNYNLNWLIDGLPAGQLTTDTATNTEFYSPGFLLGSVENDQPRLNNHVEIWIDYHEISGHRARVVGVLVQPSSRKNAKKTTDGKADCGDPASPLVLSETVDTPVTWTYSVYWRPSPTAWATRWDKYLHVFDPRIHWFSLVNSAVIVVFLTGMVGTVLLRALRKDIARYNRLNQIDLDDLSGTTAALDDGVQEDSGWKLVHGDVFRAPSHPMILSVFLGNGAQLFMMTGTTISKKQRVGILTTGRADGNCSFCSPWLPVSIQPWLHRHRGRADVHHLWLHRRLHLSEGLQNIRWRRLEAEYRSYSGSGSWNRLRHLLPS